MTPPLITLLTDFGTTDTYVGQMKGVILGICPAVRIVDLTHAIPPQEIVIAAHTLKASIAAFPAGTIHLVVVDPGVGSGRRMILAEADGRRFIGPDNGVLEPCLSGAKSAQVRELRETWFWREPVSNTFHGRDIFGPAAAHWANGKRIEEFGPEISAPLVQLPAETLRVESHGVRGEVRSIDHFGNVLTNIPLRLIPEESRSSASVTLEGLVLTGIYRCYSDVPVGALLTLGSSSGYLEISQRNGNAAADGRISRGMSVMVNWPPA